jgi:hypothetical protein
MFPLGTEEKFHICQDVRVPLANLVLPVVLCQSYTDYPDKRFLPQMHEIADNFIVRILISNSVEDKRRYQVSIAEPGWLPSS